MVGTTPRTQTLTDLAKAHKLDFFLVSFTDLLRGTLAKLVMPKFLRLNRQMSVLRPLRVTWAAGLEGITEHLTTGDRIDENMFVRGSEFPALQTLIEALRCLEQDVLLIKTLGEQGAKTFLDFKYKECSDYHTEVTQWELQQYVHC